MVAAPVSCVAPDIVRNPLPLSRGMFLSQADAPPEAVAKQFLAALDDERWPDAAQWLHPEAAEAFRRQQVDLIRMGEKWPQAPSSSDFRFTGHTDLLRVRNASEAEALSGAEMFDRFAAAVGPNAGRPGETPLRLRRIILGVHRTASDTTVRYRTEVYAGGTPLPHFPWWKDVREMSLRSTPEGWRVRDVNLGVSGGGHLLLSRGQMVLLAVACATSYWLKSILR